MEQKYFTNTGYKKTTPLFRILIRALSVSLLIAFMTTIIAFTGCAENADTFTEENNGQSIDLKVGETITVRLESNPTTGYGWFLSDKTDQSVILMFSSEYKQSPADKELVGAGGFETFKFKGAKPGTTEIILNYLKPWEEGTEPIDVFRVSITVK
jgi:inhibitor of cysteine peptidase